jgi:hypothetical protein
VQNRIHEKKKTFGYVNRSEEKRQEFQEKLNLIPQAKRVFLDEAGLDNNDEYPYGWELKGQRVYGLKKA